ncbi:hypothetical protein D4R47_04645 [archaeon]|nr:MAG: hypothetical protein D4R47_04645 [archaeon]
MKLLRYLVIVTLLVIGVSLLSQGEEEAFKANITGEKTWCLRYGFGSPQGLAQAGMAPNQLYLDQSLAVNITGKALSFLTINAQFDDQKPMNMQSLTIDLDAGDLRGKFGDFPIAEQDTFLAYNKELKGMRLDYQIGKAQLTGIVSQVEGISESKTFVGRTAHEEVIFSSYSPEQPWVKQTYLLNLQGLYYFELEEPFIEGFSIASINLVANQALHSLLSAYGLGYLFEDITKSSSQDLSKASYAVVSKERDFLILKSEPQALLRTWLLKYIRQYNEQTELSDSEEKRYPFNIGTDYEQAFLNQLMSFCYLGVEGSEYPLLTGKQQRFYYLGHADLKEGSIVVEVSLHGGTFLPITEADLPEYDAYPFLSEGIIEFDFPKQFFQETESAARVSFDYAVSGDVFMLGLSIVQGSEKVYLNGELLERDMDYSIDYELGMLILFREVGEEDTIRIDYERFRGGLGSGAEYSRNFYGLSLDLPATESLNFKLSLLQAADNPTPLSDPAKAHTMPNTHTISGVIGAIDLDGFRAKVALGYSNDCFPFDDNLRENLPNLVTTILVLAQYTLVGNLNGISVYNNGVWRSYTTGAGLCGNRVRSMVSDGNTVFIGTDSGLTVLHLKGVSPLAHVENWQRFYEKDGLPDPEVRALALVGESLWIGTTGGLARVKPEEIESAEAWKSYTPDVFPEMKGILALAGDNTTLYIGTDHGLFAFDIAKEEMSELHGMSGVAVGNLVLVDGTLYASSEIGLRSFHKGIGCGWLIFGRAVRASAIVNGSTWYATDDGLYRISDQEPFIDDWAITVLSGSAVGGLWIGSRANSSYQLNVWRADSKLETFTNYVMGIDGRDKTRFRDISSDEHTDRGLFARASFNRDVGVFKISGDFESIAPGFSSIGCLDRRDVTGWNISVAGALAQGINIVASHGYHMINQRSEEKRDIMDNQLSFAWQFGPLFSFSLRNEMVDDNWLHRGPDSTATSYSIGLQNEFLDHDLSLAVAWNDAFETTISHEHYWRESGLSFTGTYQIISGFSISGSWEYPLIFDASSTQRSEKRNLSISLSRSLAAANISGKYELFTSRFLPDGSLSTIHTASIDLRFSEFALLGLGFVPTLNLGFEAKEGTVAWDGRANVRVKLNAVFAQVTYQKKMLQVQEEQSQHDDRFLLSLGYTGTPYLRPSISYTRRTSVVAYKEEIRSVVDHVLSGRLSWAPQGSYRNDLSLVVSADDSDEITVSVQNDFSYIVSEHISTRFNIDGSYKIVGATTGNDLSLTLGGTVDYRLSDFWRGSLAISYIAGETDTTTLYHSTLFELFIAAEF